jgi:hypothetical protein
MFKRRSGRVPQLTEEPVQKVRAGATGPARWEVEGAECVATSQIAQAAGRGQSSVARTLTSDCHSRPKPPIGAWHRTRPPTRPLAGPSTDCHFPAQTEHSATHWPEPQMAVRSELAGRCWRCVG